MMPPTQRRKPSAAPVPPAAEAKTAPTASDICGACWPDGWPVNDEAASCEHGQWQR
jgi:hypothetical protein